jgi:hypothetical protein
MHIRQNACRAIRDDPASRMPMIQSWSDSEAIVPGVIDRDAKTSDDADEFAELA